MSWSAPSDDPITLPRGRELVTLKDAGTYITKLPKAEHEAPEWQAEVLILVATSGGPTRQRSHVRIVSGAADFKRLSELRECQFSAAEAAWKHAEPRSPAAAGVSWPRR